MNEVSERDIPTKQENYTPEDLKKILTGYKRIDHFKHPDFSLTEIKKYLKKYKKVFTGKKYMKIYFDNDDYKWKWNENRTTIEGLFFCIQLVFSSNLLVYSSLVLWEYPFHLLRSYRLPYSF